MKRFAWLVMFLALGLFAYTGCGGPPAGPSSTTSEEDDLAVSDMAGFAGDAGEGDDDASGDEGGEEEAGEEAASGEEPGTE